MKKQNVPVPSNPSDPAGRVTARDVAARLGVSTRTVANAYTHPDQLSAALRERVIATAAELGYRGPNPLAASLRRGFAGGVGIAYDTPLSYAFDDPAAVALLAGAASVLQARGAGLVLLSGTTDPATAATAARTALMDALLVVSVAEDDAFLRTALTRDLPTVVIDQPRPEQLPSTVAWVGIDDRAAARRSTEHLLGLGHRHLGVVSFPLTRSGAGGLSPVDVAAADASPYPVTRDRLAGVRDAVTAAGLPAASLVVVPADTSGAAAGRRAAEVLLQASTRPTALVCLSDELAAGAHGAVRARGLTVPGDVSLVGFDDTATAGHLGLSTTANPQRDKGRLAAELLTRPGRGPGGSAARYLLATTFVPRTSTGRPR